MSPIAVVFELEIFGIIAIVSFPRLQIVHVLKASSVIARLGMIFCSIILFMVNCPECPFVDEAPSTNVSRTDCDQMLSIVLVCCRIFCHRFWGGLISSAVKRYTPWGFVALPTLRIRPWLFYTYFRWKWYLLLLMNFLLQQKSSFVVVLPHIAHFSTTHLPLVCTFPTSVAFERLAHFLLWLTRADLKNSRSPAFSYLSPCEMSLHYRGAMSVNSPQLMMFLEWWIDTALPYVQNCHV